MRTPPLLWLSSPHLSSAAVAGALIASVWQGLLLTAVVAFSLRLLPGLSSAVRAALWTVVLALLVALPVLPLTLPHTPATPHAGVVHMEETVSFLLVALWAAASVFRLAELWVGALRLRGIVRRSTPVRVGGEIAAQLGALSRSVLLCTSTDVDRPSVAGFFRPRILLPEALLGALSDAELSQIVLHETEHLRRRDDWINLAQRLSLVLLPLNPALLWLNRRLAQERELACDDGVLRATRARKVYASCLARVAENTLVHRGASLALGILGDLRRRSELARRIERILGSPRPLMSPLQTRLAGGLLCAGLLGGAGLLAHCPELVSFGPATTALAHTAATGTGTVPAGTISARAVMVSATAGMGRRGAFNAPRPMLVNAVMPNPEPRLAIPVPGEAALHLRPTHPRLNRLREPRRKPALPTAPWVVLTAWHANTAPARSLPATDAADRLTPVIFATSHAWYTALPYRDGWIVVQL